MLGWTLFHGGHYSILQEHVAFRGIILYHQVSTCSAIAWWEHVTFRGIILYHQMSTCSAIWWWEHVTVQWDEDDDIHCAVHNHT